MAQETQTAALYLEEWDGEGDGREVQKGGDIYIYVCVCVCVCIYIHLWLIHVEG